MDDFFPQYSEEELNLFDEEKFLEIKENEFIDTHAVELFRQIKEYVGKCYRLEQLGRVQGPEYFKDLVYMEQQANLFYELQSIDLPRLRSEVESTRTLFLETAKAGIKEWFDKFPKSFDHLGFALIGRCEYLIYMVKVLYVYANFGCCSRLDGIIGEIDFT